jgi:precorrin-2/cobalt-factor-2 C20-methyltransferase
MQEPRAAIVGLGPGDPELTTLRAARLIEASDFVLHAGAEPFSGFAVEIVADRLRPDHKVEGLALKMARGRDDANVGYDRAARRMIELVNQHQRVVYLAEGDALFYGSGTGIAEHLTKIDRSFEFEVVPGVTSISAAAARLKRPIAIKDEIFSVCPGTYHRDEIGAIVDRGGPMCWLKARDILPELIEALGARGKLADAVLLERVGRPDERVVTNLTEALELDLSYFSLVLVR